MNCRTVELENGRATLGDEVRIIRKPDEEYKYPRAFIPYGFNQTLDIGFEFPFGTTGHIRAIKKDRFLITVLVETDDNKAWFVKQNLELTEGR